MNCLPYRLTCTQKYSTKYVVLLRDTHEPPLMSSPRSSVLLLAPLLAEAEPAPHCVPRSAGVQEKDGLLTQFQWMAEHTPGFRVPGAHIHILSSPSQFYQAIKVRKGLGQKKQKTNKQAAVVAIVILSFSTCFVRAVVTCQQNVP